MISLILYYLTLIGLLAASLFPENRIWGLNWWGFYPLWVPLSLFGLGAAAPWILRATLPAPARTGEETTSDRSFVWISGGLTAVMALAFVLLRARTFFHGDGYQLLGAIAVADPRIKVASFGESLLHIWLRQIIGGDGDRAALLSFQIIAVVAGVVAMIIVAWAARRIFSTLGDRTLFFAGMISAGFMLLFFGHVEYYALFVVCVLAFTLIGILATKGLIGRRWIVWPMLTAILMHSLGIVLLPAGLYVLMGNTRFAEWLANLSRRSKVLLAVAIAAAVGSAFGYLYATNWSFRFSFLPPWEDRFTVDGYTWFSGHHLLDLGNLLLVLLPGLALLLGLLGGVPLRPLMRKPVYRFFFLLMICALGVSFIIDPRLGMARDWNLFSFAGVPLTVLSFYLIIDNQKRIRQYRSAGILTVLLGGLVLFPRAASLVVPDVALAHFDVYRYMDLGRSWDAGIYLRVYYNGAGKAEIGDSIAVKWRATYPAARLSDRGTTLSQEGKHREAVAVLKRAIRVNPKFWSAWGSLGGCYSDLGIFDSAVTCFEIAEGLNPSNAIIYNNWAYAYLKMGKFDQAKRMWARSLELDSTMIEPLVGMATMSQALRRDQDYRRLMQQVCSREDAPIKALVRWGDYLSEAREFQSAAASYQRALAKGLDTTHIADRLKVFPKLEDYLNLGLQPLDTSR